MSSGTISGTITTSVDLGGAAYPSPLAIGSKGVVLPSAFSAAGVLAVVASAELTNRGNISGGFGHASAGGPGVDMLSGGDTMTNLGTVTGGAGRSSGKSGIGFTGGTGVEVASGVIKNAGAIAGGNGGGESSRQYGYLVGNGGTGVVLDGSSLVNTGSIGGGGGGIAGYFNVSYTGRGGTGVSVADSTSSIVNWGTITGGSGYGPTVGIDMLSGGSLLNRGTIEGGASGAGVLANDGLIANTGLVQGGFGFPGGAGISLDGGKLVNSGTIKGGGGANDNYDGNNGGAGVIISGGAVLFNSGTIGGGKAGLGYHNQPAIGGPGVVLDGGTIIDSGQIDAGSPGSAIHFGNAASTLIIEPSAFFYGSIQANSAADDKLVLAGSTGTLSTIGSQFVNFTKITEENTASWVLTGTNTIGTATTLVTAGTLAESGKLVDDGNILVAKPGVLTFDGTITGTGAIEIDGGTSLSLNGSFHGPSLAFGGGEHGTLSLGEGVTVTGAISGFSDGDTIQLALDATSLSFAGGTLTLDHGHKTVDTLFLAGSFTAGGFHLRHVVSGTDSLTDITYTGSSSDAPAVLPDFASSITPTAATESAATTAGAAALLDRTGWPDWDWFTPAHAMPR